MNKYEYVIFDLDGTLLDTQEGVILAAIHTMNKYGRMIPDLKTLESLIGPPIQVSFQNLYSLSNKDAMEMANVFRDVYMTDEFLFRATPYNGIYELMKALIKAEIKVGIATYKREDYAKKLLCEKGFDRYTKYMYGSDFEGKLKKQDIIRICLGDMGCTDYSKAVYIGDSKSDGKGANDVGMNFIAVTYGFGFKTVEEALEYNPISVVGSCIGLLNLILDERELSKK